MRHYYLHFQIKDVVAPDELLNTPLILYLTVYDSVKKMRVSETFSMAWNAHFLEEAVF